MFRTNRTAIRIYVTYHVLLYMFTGLIGSLSPTLLASLTHNLLSLTKAAMNEGLLFALNQKSEFTYLVR